MTRKEAKQKIQDILAEATETESAVCYVTSEDAEALETAIEALESQRESAKELEGKRMDRYGYIGIETLLNFCENSKDHTITPNDFMRMKRVRMPSAEPDDSRYRQGIIQGKVDMRTEILTKLKELVGEEVWSNI